MVAKYVVTEEALTKVKALASCGVHRDLIAMYLGIHSETVVKYYGDIINKAKTDRNAIVANALFDNAVRKGNVAAQIFWLKTQARWKEPKTEDEEASMQSAEYLAKIAEALNVPK